MSRLEKIYEAADEPPPSTAGGSGRTAVVRTLVVVGVMGGVLTCAAWMDPELFLPWILLTLPVLLLSIDAFRTTRKRPRRVPSRRERFEARRRRGPVRRTVRDFCARRLRKRRSRVSRRGPRWMRPFHSVRHYGIKKIDDY